MPLRLSLRILVFSLLAARCYFGSFRRHCLDLLSRLWLTFSPVFRYGGSLLITKSRDLGKRYRVNWNRGGTIRLLASSPGPLHTCIQPTYTSYQTSMCSESLLCVVPLDGVCTLLRNHTPDRTHPGVTRRAHSDKGHHSILHQSLLYYTLYTREQYLSNRDGIKSIKHYVIPPTTPSSAPSSRRSIITNAPSPSSLRAEYRSARIHLCFIIITKPIRFSKWW